MEKLKIELNDEKVDKESVLVRFVVSCLIYVRWVGVVEYFIGEIGCFFYIFLS